MFATNLLVVFVCIISSVVPITNAIVITPAEFSSAFENWADNYGISFSSAADKQIRFTNFQENLQKFSSQNGQSETLYDINSWADKTPQELSSIFTGAVPPAVVPEAIVAPEAVAPVLTTTNIIAIAASGGGAIILTAATVTSVIVIKKRNLRKKKEKQQQQSQQQQQPPPTSPGPKLQQQQQLPTSPQQLPTSLPPPQHEISTEACTTPKKIQENLRKFQENSPGKLLEIVQRTDSNSKTADAVKDQGGVDILTLTPKRRAASITARKLSFSERD